MSIFVAQLAFEGQDDELMIAKTGIILTSVFAGLSGYTWLWFVGKDKRYENSSVLLVDDQPAK